MIPDEGDVLAVALSGGKDSLTLLSMLKKILGFGFPKKQLIAIHVSGAFSCGAGLPTGSLEAICQSLHVPLFTRESTQTLQTLACYSCSRERRSLLFEEAKKQGASHIAFGHHKDDNLQTFLLNLLKKGEFEGHLPVVPMKKYGVTIIRPLHFVHEEMIRHYARQQNFLRVTCQCPRGQTSKRKAVEEVLAQMSTIFPEARHNIHLALLKYGGQKAKGESIDAITT